MTVREIISNVRQSLHSINLDDWIPAKLIHHELINKGLMFLKRESDSKNCHNYPDIWTTVDLEMVEDDLTSFDLPGDNKVMKSRKHLPFSYTTRAGYLLELESVNFSKSYKVITPKTYQTTLSREFKDPNVRYAWIENNRLIIPESLVKNITVRGVFVNKAEALRLNSHTRCINMMDQEFTVPGHILGDVIDATVLQLAKVYKQIVPDENPNLNSLEKTKTPNAG